MGFNEILWETIIHNYIINYHEWDLTLFNHT